MSNIKNISDNDLSELQCLLSDINYQIERYGHVEHLLPTDFKNSFIGFFDAVNNEKDRREDLD